MYLEIYLTTFLEMWHDDAVKYLKGFWALHAQKLVWNKLNCTQKELGLNIVGSIFY